jgi:hypothetical protein
MRNLLAALLVLPSLAVVSLSLPNLATADTLDDPLHGIVCSGAGTGCTNTDNNSFAPLTTTNWGFQISPGPATGNLTLVFGIPTNEINPATFNLPSLTDNGGSIADTVFSRTSFYTTSSPDLSLFLGLGNFSPTDNFSNLSAGTAASDPTFNGDFLIFTATLTGVTLDANGATTLANDFMFGSNAPAGSFITGLFTDANGNIGTAASGHLVVQPLAVTPTPLPGSVWNGVSGLALFGLAMLAMNRRKNRGQSCANVSVFA